MVISLDNAGGTLTDISGSSNAVSLTFSNEVGTYRRAGSDAPTRYLEAQDLSISLSVVYSTASGEGLALLRAWAAGSIGGGDARTIRIDVPDSTSGSDRYQVEVLPGNLEIPLASNEGGPVLVTAALESTGAYTVSTI
ncbi:MAG: hypothetical protein GTO03_13460 [Planctomycetales bacterium]|nr:hypothetical protein [Planctomycetales bacterium]